MLDTLKRIWPIVVDELRATYRGFVDFYRGFFGYLIPERSGLITWLPVMAVAGLTIFYAYWAPSLPEPARSVSFYVLAGLGLAYLVGGLLYIRMTQPRSWAASNIAASLTTVVTLVIVFAHPIFPGWLKLVAAGAVMVGAIQVARKRIREKQTSSADRRAQIRGAIIALIPFYMLAFVNLTWGINQEFTDPLRDASFPAKDKLPAYIAMFEGRKWDVWAGEDSSAAYPTFAREVDGVPVPRNPAYTNDIPGHAFWAYGFKRVMGLAIEDPMELVYQIAVHPIGLAMGVAMTPPSEFGIARIISWHPLIELLEIILGIITGAFFLGIVAEMALTIQRRNETGEADIDLTQDHGVALLAGANSLATVAEANAVKRSWVMLRRIHERAVQRLSDRLHDENERVRQAAAFALAAVEATSATPALRARYDREPKDRVRAAILAAMANLAPVRTLPDLRNALRGDNPVLARTALSTVAELVERVLDDADAAASVDAPDDAEPVPLNEEAAQTWLRGELKVRLRTGLRELLVDSLDLPESDVRDVLTSLLTRFREEKVGQEVLERLHGKPARSIAWRQGALQVLGRLRWQDGEATLVEFAAHESTTLRVAALAGLAEGEGEASLALLRDAVDDADPTVRRAAFASLCRRGTEEDLPRLLAGMTDVDEQARILAIRAVSGVCRSLRHERRPVPERVFASLAEIAGDKQDSLLRDEASFALAESGDPRAREILEANLPDPEAALALGRLGDAASVQALYQAALDTANEPAGSLPRLAPVQALGQLGAEASPALQELYRLRADQRDAVADCRAVADALARIGDEPSVQFLAALFNPRDRQTARYLAPALARTRTEVAKRRLLGALTGPAGPIAIRALAETHDPDVLPHILPLLNNSDPEIREAAFQTVAMFSVDPASSDETLTTLRRTLHTMGSRAVSLLRVVGRVTGNLWVSDDSQDEPEPPGRRDDRRPRAERVLSEFG